MSKRTQCAYVEISVPDGMTAKLVKKGGKRFVRIVPLPSEEVDEEVVVSAVDEAVGEEGYIYTEAFGAPDRVGTEEGTLALHASALSSPYRRASSELFMRASTGSYRVSSATPSRELAEDDDSNSDIYT